jgi:ubiquitin-conjugating enzyme E2 U
MASRTSLLIQKEITRLKTQKLYGIDVNLTNMYEWQVILSGPIDTVWENAQFKICIYFPLEFNENPPDINFITVPFHPNIDMETGKPCIAFLENELWRKDLDISQILIHIQV